MINKYLCLAVLASFLASTSLLAHAFPQRSPVEGTTDLTPKELNKEDRKQPDARPVVPVPPRDGKIDVILYTVRGYNYKADPQKVADTMFSPGFKSFVQQQSRGKFVISQVNVLGIKNTNLDRDAACQPAIVRQAIGEVDKNDNNADIVVHVPIMDYDCNGMKGVADVGGKLVVYRFFERNYAPSTLSEMEVSLTHEMLHTMGSGHASYLNCPKGVPFPTPNLQRDKNCVISVYNDSYSLMGDSRATTSIVDLYNLIKLDWLSYNDTITQFSTPVTNKSFTFIPTDAYKSTPKGLEILTPTYYQVTTQTGSTSYFTSLLVSLQSDMIVIRWVPRFRDWKSVPDTLVLSYLKVGETYDTGSLGITITRTSDTTVSVTMKEGYDGSKEIIKVNLGIATPNGQSAVTPGRRHRLHFLRRSPAPIIPGTEPQVHRRDQVLIPGGSMGGNELPEEVIDGPVYIS